MVNMTTIRIILVLWASCYCWTMHLVDVCGAFLKGNFEEHKEKVFMEVPQGFEHIYKQVGKKCQEGCISKDKMAGRALELHEE